MKNEMKGLDLLLNAAVNDVFTVRSGTAINEGLKFKGFVKFNVGTKVVIMAAFGFTNFDKASAFFDCNLTINQVKKV